MSSIDKEIMCFKVDTLKNDNLYKVNLQINLNRGKICMEDETVTDISNKHSDYIKKSLSPLINYINGEKTDSLKDEKMLCIGIKDDCPIIMDIDIAIQAGSALNVIYKIKSKDNKSGNIFKGNVYKSEFITRDDNIITSFINKLQAMVKTVNDSLCNNHNLNPIIRIDYTGIDMSTLPNTKDLKSKEYLDNVPDCVFEAITFESITGVGG